MPGSPENVPQPAALPASPSQSRFVYVLGIYMLAKAVALVFLGLWVGKLISDPTGQLEKLRTAIRYVHMDPDGRLLHRLLEHLSLVHASRLHLISAGFYVYAVLHLAEGIGLVGRWRWGEWVVVVSTSALIPFEVYEFVHRPTLVRASVIIVNVAIALYFVYRLLIHAEKPIHVPHPGSDTPPHTPPAPPPSG